MTSIAVEAAARRLGGQQQSRPRALLAAGAAAVATGVVVYKFLRSGEQEEGDN